MAKSTDAYEAAIRAALASNEGPLEIEAALLLADDRAAMNEYLRRERLLVARIEEHQAKWADAWAEVIRAAAEAPRG